MLTLYKDSNGLHLLFESFTLEDSNNIWTGYLLVWMICTIERCVTYYLDKKSSDADTRKRLFIILQRTLLYGIATTMRLLYMLIIMYFNTGLFMLVVCFFLHIQVHTFIQFNAFFIINTGGILDTIAIIFWNFKTKKPSTRWQWL